MEINYSIIIPHKNSPKLLAYCLTTIPVRDDVQVIVVDDNSDPQKVDIVHFPQWKGKHYEYYLTKDGKGAGYARNVGLEHAKGKWLLFADADDFFLPVINEVLDENVNSDADIIYFRPQAVMSEDRRTPSPRADLYTKWINDYHKNQSELALRLSWAPVWSRIIRHELVIGNHIRFDEIQYSNDLCFSMRIGCVANKIEVSDSSLYVITQSNDSLTANNFQKEGAIATRTKACIDAQYIAKQHGYPISEGYMMRCFRNLFMQDKTAFFEYFRYALGLGYSRVRLSRRIFPGRTPKAIIKQCYTAIVSFVS